MKIKTKCSHCQTVMAVDDSLNGRQVRCPKCREVFQIAAILPEASPSSQPLGLTPETPDLSSFPSNQSASSATRQSPNQSLQTRPATNQPQTGNSPQRNPASPQRQAAQQSNSFTNNPFPSQPIQPLLQQPAASAFEVPLADPFDMNDLDSLVALEKNSVAIEQQNVPRFKAQPLQPVQQPKKKSKKTKAKKSKSSSQDIIELRNQYFAMVGITFLVLILGMPLCRAIQVPIVGIIFLIALAGCAIFQMILYIKLTYRLWGVGGAILCWLLGRIPIFWLVIVIMIYFKTNND